MNVATLQAKLENVGWNEVVKIPELGPCWEWKGYRNNKRGGYGQASWLGKLTGAHRLSYTCWVGDIPVDLHVLHHCDNPPCINPSHLFVGTNLDNMKDRDAKGRHVAGRCPGSRHPMARLVESDIVTIHEMLDFGNTLDHVASQYGVTKQTIWAIRKGNTWKHVQPQLISHCSIRKCEYCDEPFVMGIKSKHQLFCSGRCKQRMAKQKRELEYR